MCPRSSRNIEDDDVVIMDHTRGHARFVDAAALGRIDARLSSPPPTTLSDNEICLRGLFILYLYEL